MLARRRHGRSGTRNARLPPCTRGKNMWKKWQLAVLLASTVVAAAADAGAITMENDVMVVAGSNVGSDTAWVMQPANSRRIFDIKVKELVAKPENF